MHHSLLWHSQARNSSLLQVSLFPKCSMFTWQYVIFIHKQDFNQQEIFDLFVYGVYVPKP